MWRKGKVTEGKNLEGRGRGGWVEWGQGFGTLTTIAAHWGLRACSLFLPLAPADHVVPSYVLVMCKEKGTHRCVFVHTLTLT